MTCAEFKAELSALALSALEPDERAECERHLAGPGPHEGCREAFALAERTLSMLASSLPPVAPRPLVWDAIEEAIAPPARPEPIRWLPWLGWLSAAAMAAMLLWGQGLLLHARAERDQVAVALAAAQGTTTALRQCEHELEQARGDLGAREAALALLAAPETELVPLGAQGGAPYRASALYNPAQRRAVVLASALSPQPGKDYELWVIRGGAKLPAGLFHPGAGGSALIAIDSKLLAQGAPDALAVTVEPTGGAPSPTGPNVLVGKVLKG
ncbi:MAG: anti-sigma factor domain-containing protein [Deltaproteobacteria bacterium]